MIVYASDEINFYNSNFMHLTVKMHLNTKQHY